VIKRREAGQSNLPRLDWQTSTCQRHVLLTRRCRDPKVIIIAVAIALPVILLALLIAQFH
jgi:hypothetical protein